MYLSLTSQYFKSVARQVDLCGVHGDGRWGVREAPGVALHDVDAPALVVVAAAVVRARHLAVAGIKVTAVAECEAVSLVRTEEVSALCLEMEILVCYLDYYEYLSVISSLGC